ncbi:MAG: hemolysin family protein [Planctomycetota bacterium]
MLADAVVRLFSRTQLEDLLDEREARPWRRYFCAPFLIHGEALSLSCSILSVCATGAYFGWGLLHAASDGAGPWTAALLTVPLLLAAAAVNILARHRTEETLYFLAPLLWLITLPVRPAGALVIRLEERLARVLGRESENETEDREEILAAVTDGEHEGVVKENEREMIVNIFDLKDFDISDIMRPRTDICAVNVEEPLDAAVALALKRGYSRIPVFQETRDNIKGIFYIKDALRYWGGPREKMPSLREIMRPPFFVPETKSVGDLMRELQEKKMHLAIVLDEYGGTAGLVTIEDIIEEIVGEIQDEYDAEEGALLRTLGPGRLEADARVRVHDMNEALDDEILPETGDYETLGGFVLDRLGHVPQPGESLVWKAVRFTVLTANERKIGRVLVETPWEEPMAGTTLGASP